MIKKKKDLKVLIFKIVIVFVLLSIDLLSKHFFALYFSKGNNPIIVFPKILSFVFVKNTGAAFGIFSNGTLWLTIFSVVLISLIFVYDYFNKSNSFWYNASFMLICAGALGNFIDRVFLGYVRDFVSFDFINFAVFNIADAMLTVGIICYAIYVLFVFDKEKAGDKNAK